VLMNIDKVGSQCVEIENATLIPPLDASGHESQIKLTRATLSSEWTWREGLHMVAIPNRIPKYPGAKTN